MKIIFCNIPIRKEGGVFPPLGVTRLIDALHEAKTECEIDFYNIDMLRPKENEVVEYFIENKPDVVAISAVVSTSYGYVKWLSKILKDNLKDVTIILGGNLAVSYNVILNKSDVDFCVIGEGEETIVDLCNYFLSHGRKINSLLLEKIPGIAYCNKSNSSKIIFTGYRKQLEAGKIRQANYELLDRYYLMSSRLRFEIANTPGLVKNNYGKEGYVELAKGCINKCTFCHRWGKGYRIIPLDNVFRHIKNIIDKYDVDYISFADENFGSNRKHLDEFLERIKDFNIHWHVAGMRVRSAKPELIKKMKNAGCVGIYFGIESGSNKMLTIMEKNATPEDNIAALGLIAENEMHTILPLLVGMPGETNETIQETISFLRRVKETAGDDYLRMSITYAQALPGTPLYDYAYKKHLIENTIKGEEEYLLKISDTDAANFSHFINMTDASDIEVLTWPRLIEKEVNGVYFSGSSTSKRILNKVIPLAENLIGKRAVWFLLMPLLVYRRYKNINHVLELLFRKKRKNICQESIKTQSLRKTINEMSSDLPLV